MNDNSNLTFLRQIEEKYETENRLMNAVMNGQIHRVEKIVQTLCERDIFKYSTNSVRNVKNYAIIANTLFRKAAEQGMVHPTQLHNLSEKFVGEIELATTEQAIVFILKTMARKYTLLVKNHSLKGYSPLIRKILVHIDSDLSADLSLKAHAKQMHVNSSYLSSLFKKETGQTLTQYVTQKRMEHAMDLLRTTSLQIQAIALQCGIHDICYFTKTFKNFTGKAPSEYRKDFF